HDGANGDSNSDADRDTDGHADFNTNGNTNRHTDGNPNGYSDCNANGNTDTYSGMRRECPDDKKSVQEWRVEASQSPRLQQVQKSGGLHSVREHRQVIRLFRDLIKSGPCESAGRFFYGIEAA